MDKRILKSAASLALCLIGGIGLGTSSAPAASKPAAPNFKPMDVFDLQWAADPQISPDGRSIAYVRMGMDVKTMVNMRDRYPAQTRAFIRAGHLMAGASRIWPAPRMGVLSSSSIGSTAG
jgi:hypothetical protein